MKKLILVAALSVAFGSAFAQTSTSGSTSTATSTGGAANNAGNTQQIVFQSGGDSTSTVNQTINGTQTTTINGTQTQIVGGGTTNTNTNTNINEQRGEVTENQNVNHSGGYTVRQEFGTQKIKNTPSVSGPPLTTSNDTCMGSSSGSANVPGLGIGLGTTWTDENCTMLKNARELWNMGMRGAAIARLCMDPKNKESLEITGTECPQTIRDREARMNASAAIQSNEPTDPIIRRRLGLPPL